MQSWLEPLTPGGESMRDYLTSRNLLPEDMAAKLDNALDYALRVMSYESVKEVGKDVMPSPGMIETLVTSVVGAEISKRAFQKAQGLMSGGSSRISGGPTLVLAARGAQAARAVFSQMPNAKLRAVLQDALAGEPIRPGDEPYSLLKELLAGPSRASGVVEQFRRVNLYMWNAGYHGTQWASDEYVDTDFAADNMKAAGENVRMKAIELNEKRKEMLGINDPTEPFGGQGGAIERDGKGPNAAYDESTAAAQQTIEKFGGVDTTAQDGTMAVPQMGR